VPDESGFGDVAALGGVDAVEVADAFAMFGVLPIGDVDLPSWMTGVLMTSLRVLGQTESLGFMSNSQSFLPSVAS
jgi:hypothetical protein